MVEVRQIQLRKIQRIFFEVPRMSCLLFCSSLGEIEDADEADQQLTRNDDNDPIKVTDA